MSFSEIIIIAIVAVLVLGPEKLPGTLIELAKLIKGIKKQINEAKQAVENEINLAELKDEAERYKREISAANESIRKKLTFDELNEVGQELKAVSDELNQSANEAFLAGKNGFENNAAKDDETNDAQNASEQGAPKGKKRAAWAAEQAQKNAANACETGDFGVTSSAGQGDNFGAEQAAENADDFGVAAASKSAQAGDFGVAAKDASQKENACSKS